MYFFCCCCFFCLEEKTIQEISCEVTTEDFLKAMETLIPSVTPEQYKQYQAIKAKIEKQ